MTTHADMTRPDHCSPRATTGARRTPSRLVASAALAIALAFGGALAASPANGAIIAKPAPKPKPVPAGYQTTTLKQLLSISLPSNYLSVDLTRETIQSFEQQYAAAHPGKPDPFGGFTSSQVAQLMKLMAVEPNASFHTIVMVGVLPTSPIDLRKASGSALLSYVKMQFTGVGGSGASTTLVKLDGTRSALYTATLGAAAVSEPAPARVAAYLTPRKHSRVALLFFIVPADGSNDAVLSTMVHSITFTR